MTRTILYNAGVVTMDPQRRQYRQGGILVENDRIAAIGVLRRAAARAEPGIECIDLDGHWLLPGLINTHVHTSQQLGRGLGDDVSLLTWFHDRIWPYESNLTEEDSYISTLLCGIEQIRSGVTCFAEPEAALFKGIGRHGNGEWIARHSGKIHHGQRRGSAQEVE